MRYAIKHDGTVSESGMKCIAMVVDSAKSACYPDTIGCIFDCGEKDMRRRYMVSVNKNKVWYYRTLRTAMTDNNIAFMREKQ